MKIIWSEDDFYIEKPFFYGMMGLKHNNKRPDTVEILLDEIPSYVFPEVILQYIRKDLAFAVQKIVIKMR